MDRIPLFPLDVVVFPWESFGLQMFEDRYVMMAEDVIADGLPIGMVLRRPGQIGKVEVQPMELGTALEVRRSQMVGDRYLLDTFGTRRFRVKSIHTDKPYQEATVEWLDEPTGDIDVAIAARDALLVEVEHLGVDVPAFMLDEFPLLSFVLAELFCATVAERQAILEAPDAAERLMVLVRQLELDDAP